MARAPWRRGAARCFPPLGDAAMCGLCFGRCDWQGALCRDRVAGGARACMTRTTARRTQTRARFGDRAVAAGRWSAAASRRRVLAQEKRAQAGARHGAWAVAARPVARPGALALTSVRLREHDVGAGSPEWHAAATQHGLPMGAWTWQEVGLICNFASGELAAASQARHTGSRAVGGREARRRGARPLGARTDDARLGRAQSGGTDRSVTVVYIAGAGRVREPAAGPRAVPHVPGAGDAAGGLS